jgi:hypothetical protein
VVRRPHSVAAAGFARNDERLTDLRDFLTARHPQRARKSIDAQCQTVFDPPPETRRDKRNGERSIYLFTLRSCENAARQHLQGSSDVQTVHRRIGEGGTARVASAFEKRAVRLNGRHGELGPSSAPLQPANGAAFRCARGFADAHNHSDGTRHRLSVSIHPARSSAPKWRSAWTLSRCRGSLSVGWLCRAGTGSAMPHGEGQNLGSFGHSPNGARRTYEPSAGVRD